MKKILFILTILITLSFLTFCEREDIFEFSTAPQKIYLFSDGITRNGNLGGLSGGAAICRSILESNFPQRNMATVILFASDDSNNLKDRLPAGVPVYGIKTGNIETLISSTTEGLWDGTIDVTLDTATDVTNSWWTGSDQSGNTVPAQTCSSFTDGSNTSDGAYGSASFTNNAWINEGTPEPCGSNYQILCAGW